MQEKWRLQGWKMLRRYAREVGDKDELLWRQVHAAFRRQLIHRGCANQRNHRNRKINAPTKLAGAFLNSEAKRDARTSRGGY
jgi:hypothetical protein